MAMLFCMSCVPKALPVKAVAVTPDDCSAVYKRALIIEAVTELNANPNSLVEMQQAVTSLDETKRADGTADKFWDSCIFTMNAVQADCMKEANSLAELNQCARMYANY